MIRFETIGETTVTGSYTPDPSPVVGPVRVTHGVAGQISARVIVTYSGEQPRPCEFVGSVYGGPVVAVFAEGPQIFVREAARFGEFGADPAEWVRRYFA
jgi:hypothetical protein